MRQHGFCYILNIPARPLEQAPATVQKKSGLVYGCTSATKAGKRMKSYLVVLSVSMVLFIVCKDNCHLIAAIAMCKGYCHLAVVCGMSNPFPFDLVTSRMCGKERNSWDVWLSLRYWFAIIFLALCLVLLSTSPHKSVAHSSPPGQLQNDLTVKMCGKTSILSVFFFLGIDGVERRNK